jgi:dCTP deaminase
MSGDAEHPYNLKKGAKYRDQSGAVASKISEDDA